MIINLSDFFNREGMSGTKEISLELDSFHNGIEAYRIISQTPLTLHMSYIENGKMKLTGSLKLVADLQCDRCLKSVETAIEVSIEREIYAPDREDLDGDLLEDQSFMDGYQLDLDALLQEEICMNWPLKILCKDDCKGICRVCGKDLNEGECGCDTFVPDPRMAAIADLFKS